jgi:hypothetical protein
MKKTALRRAFNFHYYKGDRIKVDEGTGTGGDDNYRILVGMPEDKKKTTWKTYV